MSTEINPQSGMNLQCKNPIFKNAALMSGHEDSSFETFCKLEVNRSGMYLYLPFGNALLIECE